MANNTTSFGVQNISGLNVTNQNASAWNISEFSNKFGETFASSAAGSVELAGLLGLALMGFMMFKSDLKEDIQAAVMVPTVFFMASQGYLPFGQGIVYAMLLAVSGIFIFGLIKWADR